MNTANLSARSGGIMSWLYRAESWLDARGRLAWIAAMIVAFVFVWPVGLALLAYVIWSKRMFKSASCRKRRDAGHGTHWSHSDKWGTYASMRPSGNTAFESYKSETLRRLEEEQDAFEAFLQRLRDAKDKSEFDTFMTDRARANAPAPEGTDTPRGEY